jgi:multidrug resistance efflux pump
MAGSLLIRVGVTLAAVAVAAIVGWQLWTYYMLSPWTRDGTVRADVVQVAPDVSGLVAEVLVHDNEEVRRDQPLFRIDPIRFRLALQQAEAVVAGQDAKAQEAVREMKRFGELTNLEVSVEQRQQRTAVAIETGAAFQQAVADRDVARLNLERSEVRASVNGKITNFSMRPGDYVTAGRGLFALIDTDSLHVAGYFEETKLRHIRVGDPARVTLMGDQRWIDGHVQSIAGGVSDRERATGPDLLANVNPTFNWVRLARRIPVRIALDRVPPGVQVLVGRTATVQILPSRAEPTETTSK